MTTTPATKTIRQTVHLNATPNDVYEAFMDAAKHAAFTGAPATVSRDVGGAFTAYDDGIRGTNRELVPGSKIVQAWQCKADGWDTAHYSDLSITLHEDGDGTRLELEHEGVPEAAYDVCDAGWREEYWNKMKSALGW